MDDGAVRPVTRAMFPGPSELREMSQRVVYEFGGCRFDPVDARLVSGDHVIQLTAKASDTLLALVQQPNHVVSKQDLMTALWPDAAVEENNLNQQISAIRKALSHNGHTVSIETVPKRGYRFVGSVIALKPCSGIEGMTIERSRSWMRRIGSRAPGRHIAPSYAMLLALTGPTREALEQIDRGSIHTSSAG
jgi:DNA-binding winged helix-turn-helix (wHTH) protein